MCKRVYIPATHHKDKRIRAAIASNVALVVSYLRREVLDDVGGLDADMDDALYCCDEVARVLEPAVWVVEDAVDSEFAFYRIF